MQLFHDFFRLRAQRIKDADGRLTFTFKNGQTIDG